MMTKYYAEFEELLDKLKYLWARNEIRAFLTTTQEINILFSKKIDELIKQKETVHTYIIDTEKAEEKLHKLNTLVGEINRMKTELSVALSELTELQAEVQERKSK